MGVQISKFNIYLVCLCSRDSSGKHEKTTLHSWTSQVSCYVNRIEFPGVTDEGAFGPESSLNIFVPAKANEIWWTLKV